MRVGTFKITKRTHKMEQGAGFNHAQIKVEALCNVKDEKRSRCRAASNTEKSHQKSMDERRNSYSACLGLSECVLKKRMEGAYTRNIKKVNRRARLLFRFISTLREIRESLGFLIFLGLKPVKTLVNIKFMFKARTPVE